MNEIFNKIVSGASDATSLARSIADSGIQSVNEVFRNTKIFGSLSASHAENAEYDETHYVLVPVLGGAEEEYAVYTKRILPPDIGATNSLPKARFFHVPDESGKELLERELVAKIVGERSESDSSSSDFADALEKVATQIDQETNKISGGLILIGGAVAIVNPVLGIGIAAKALLPSIGTKASKAGAEYVGDKLRKWNRSSAASKLEKKASKEVKTIKPQIYANPILRGLEAIATNPQTDYDPALDRRNWSDEFEFAHYYGVTTEAIREVYRDTKVLKNRDGIYQEVHLGWIRSMLETNE